MTGKIDQHNNGFEIQNVETSTNKRIPAVRSALTSFGSAITLALTLSACQPETPNAPEKVTAAPIIEVLNAKKAIPVHISDHLNIVSTKNPITFTRVIAKNTSGKNVDVSPSTDFLEEDSNNIEVSQSTLIISKKHSLQYPLSEEALEASEVEFTFTFKDKEYTFIVKKENTTFPRVTIAFDRNEQNNVEVAVLDTENNSLLSK